MSRPVDRSEATETPREVFGLIRMSAPTHPIYVHFTIALTTASAAFDALGFFFTAASLGGAGWWTLAGSIIMTLLRLSSRAHGDRPDLLRLVSSGRLLAHFIVARGAACFVVIPGGDGSSLARHARSRIPGRRACLPLRSGGRRLLSKIAGCPVALSKRVGQVCRIED
jgi:hypothetical protein